jgi:DNA-binding XRE family transcriptional regulator
VTRVAYVTVAGKTVPVIQKSAVAALGDGFVELDDLIAAYEADQGSDFFSEARVWAAGTAFGDDDTLASLRMKAGLSQAQLAARMGMKQPQLARMERGRHDVQVSMIERLATALQLEEDTVYRAVKRTLRQGVDANG